MVALSLGSTAVAQRAPDPSSRTWNVELNGQLNRDEYFLFVPWPMGDGTWGAWFNYQGETLYGWGQYTWNPTLGTIQYVNVSGDGGGIQTGEYTWDGSKYVRTRTSHPSAPSLSLL